MIKEIQAKKMLSTVKGNDTWFGLKYNMNLYRGCQHGCIYCDSRSECYQIENFNDTLVKVNAIDLLAKELPSKRKIGTIGTGSMSDPYIPLEKKYKLTQRALELIHRYKFPIHMITKSDMVIRDIDVLKEINKIYAAISFTITTADDVEARKIEPGAPSPSKRFKAMKALSDAGIYTGITMMPILPFIQDTEKNVTSIVEQVSENGGQYILPWMGMTLRDRQREYFYDKLDKYYPGVSEKYKKAFGEKYDANSPKAKKLYELLNELCVKYGIKTSMDKYEDKLPKQMKLF